jgi:hypothetical protein
MANTRRDESLNGCMIHVKDNKYKTPYRRANGMPGNTYYYRTLCAMCGRDYYQAVRNSSPGRRPICSPECKKVMQSAPDGATKYKRGGREGGVILIKSLKHPHAKKGWIPEHRDVVEKYMGRFLDPQERVHHINMCPEDNVLLNLHVCANPSEHNRCHNSLNACVKELLGRGVLVFDRGEGVYRYDGTDWLD